MSNSFATLIGVVCTAGFAVYVPILFTLWVTRVIDRLMDEVEEVAE